jgi:hypothetical protein
MNASEHRQFLIGTCLVGLLIPAMAWSQSSVDNLKKRMEGIQAAAKEIPEAQRKMLSGGTQNLIHMADNWDSVGAAVARAAARAHGGGGSTRGSGHHNEGSNMIPVSNPDPELSFRMTGFTQSETSTAWCGSNVVVGFNDSGSFLETFDGFTQGTTGLSGNGVAFSSDRGRTFQDIGPLNPGPDPSGFLLGDPVIGCANESTFYYSSLFQSGFSDPVSAISVSRSTDGGATWGNPVPAVSKSLFTHFLDKDWMTVDPANPNPIFVTYTDFDFSGTVCGFDPAGFPIFRNAIELVRSTDNGSTWSSPVVIQEFCGGTGFVQFSQVAVGPGGEVYVAWEVFGASPSATALIRKSTDHGVTFGNTSTIASIVFVGDPLTALFQGGFRSGADISLAVDRSGKKATNGNLYLTWQDGGGLQVPSFSFLPDTYNFSDALLSRSSDGGATWSPAVRVNDNGSASGDATDQYQPGVAVDKTGKVAVCFYDRRLDPQNFLIDRFCATSTNAGATWTNTRQSTPSWAPWHATDVQVNPFYMGDYDGMASDSTNSKDGFIGAFQFINAGGNGNTNSEDQGNPALVPNPDVFAVKLN